MRYVEWFSLFRDFPVAGRVYARWGRVVPVRHGTTQLLFDPIELLERLAALTPRPRINLILYCCVQAPRAAWRSLVVARMVSNTGLPVSALIEVGKDHRLADPEPLERMLRACDRR